jgi:hypothetical protein
VGVALAVVGGILLISVGASIVMRRRAAAAVSPEV